MTSIALPIIFASDGAAVGGETLLTEAGASVLVLASCSAALGIELRGAYLAGEGNHSLLVAESSVIGAQRAGLRSRSLEIAAEAITFERRLLLYDHLHAFQDLADRAGHRLSVDGLDAAASVLDPHLRIES
ncbi:MAG: hypothetical protein AB7V58_17190 [Solirubrobacterales bacterium]